MKLLVQISRVLVGVLFIISGLIKANDSLGFSYKLEEYFEVFHMPFFVSMALPMAMVICIFEIIVGVLLLIGAYTKLNSWLLLVMIVFFTWLTGYSAVYNKVTDCGCFGDAIKLTPWQSFTKDIVLLIFILLIFIGQKHIKPLFGKAIQSVTIFTFLFASTGFTILAYMFLPFVDFLPYKEGNDIESLSAIPPGAPVDEYEMVFIYEKGGQQFEFKSTALPADLDTYKFVDRKDKLVKQGYKPPIHDFKIYDSQGAEQTDLFFIKDEYQLVLIQYNLQKTHKSFQPKINQLANDWQDKAQKRFWALTGTTLADAELYRHDVQAPYEYYNVDGTALKTAIRSNPGIMLMKKGVVVKKWSAFEIPTFETVQKYMK